MNDIFRQTHSMKNVSVSWASVLLYSASWIVGCLLAGCQGKSAYRAMAGSYYLSPNADLLSLGRVALVELDNDSSYPEIAENATEAVYVALQKKQRFGLKVVSQDEAIWRSLQSETDSSYSAQQLLEMRKVLGCDAFLTGTVTQYEPYPNLSIGLRIKLIDLRSGDLVWAVEQVWDSSDKSVYRRIKQYLKSQNDFGPGAEDLVVMSSLKFLKFVGYEIAETLRMAQEGD